MECNDAELSILLTSDFEIHQLNHDYRNKDKPTDVLSFALREGEGREFAGDMLGDIVISLETAERQAADRGITLTDEVLRLLIHGTLHLLGYDHENVSRAEAKRMFDKEQELFELLSA